MQILYLFILLLILSLVSTIGNCIRTVSRSHGRRLYQWFFSSQDWYLAWNMDTTNKGELQFQLSLLAVKMFVEDILTFIILYNNLIPIS
jgi:phospholipid-transporting ATPase